MREGGRHPGRSRPVPGEGTRQRAGTIRIGLLGPPEITVDARPLPPPRGRKTWAVLAYLLLARDRPSRSRLSELGFAGARDPRAALRWSLMDLRHLLHGWGDVSGDPVELHLPYDAEVDLWEVLDGTAHAEVACLRGELLEGLPFSSSEPLERWLGMERQRLAMACRRILLTAAETARDAGQEERATQLAADLVALDPWSLAPDQPAPSR